MINKVIDISNSLFFIYGQEYNYIECDAPWKTVKLPTNEIFKRIDDNITTIKDKIISDSKYNGIWMSNNAKLYIYFQPKKSFFTYFKPNIVTVEGLINANLTSIKRTPFLHEYINKIENLRSGGKKKIKARILEYFKNRKINLCKYKYENTPYHHLPNEYEFQPLTDFIACNYSNTDYKEVSVSNLLDILKTVKDEALLHSPFMTKKDEYEHCNTILQKVEEMKVEFPDYVLKLKELKRFIKELIMKFKSYKTSISILDFISERSLSLGFNLSTIIYNYNHITNMSKGINNNTYMFYKSKECLIIIYCLLYDNSIPLNINTVNKISLDGIDHMKNIYVIYNEVCDKIKPFEKYIKINDVMKKSVFIYIVQVQIYKYDVIKTNSKYYSKITGSVRINPLRKFHLNKN